MHAHALDQLSLRFIMNRNESDREDYIGDYEGWSMLQQNLEEREVKIYPKERDIWWCSMDVNVGNEVDGKNENFEDRISFPGGGAT